jgi:hypothetical protein
LAKLEIHQLNKIFTLKYEQEYEPKERGLDHVSIVRNVPILEVNFYKVLPDDEMKNEAGYQAPLEDVIFDQVRLNLCKKNG